VFVPPAVLACVAVALAVGLVGGIALLLTTRRRDARLAAALEANRLSEERLRLAVEATSEIVWDWDLDTDAIYMPRFAQVYGHAEEVCPKTGGELVGFVHPDDVPTFARVVGDVRSGRTGGFEFEHRMRTGSGEYRWMLGRARAVARDPDGAALRIVGTCTDVTERRRMLERLQIADRMVSVGTLAAGVAHEINNPLSFVRANLTFSLEELERSAAGGDPSDRTALRSTLEDCRIALREAVNGAERVQRIVRDLRMLSHPSEERAEPIDVRRALEAALHIARSELQRRARIVTHLADVPPVLGDDARVSQVFLNLLVNAAQSIEEGRPDRNEIELTLARLDSRVVVQVRDTGCGIPQENLKRIFDPFFTTKPVGVGTGLGLAISHRIVASLGGEIDVVSAAGRGSTFTVVLPVAPRGAAEAEPPPPRGEPARGLRVLVVDDEPLFCRAVVRMLSPGHAVVAVEDPREALRRIELGERFDVVLSDIHMPGLSGIELHAAVERVAPELAARMLFVTGGAFGSTAADFLDRMKGRVLEKPLEASQIQAAIGGLLRPRAEAPASA